MKHTDQELKDHGSVETLDGVGVPEEAVADEADLTVDLLVEEVLIDGMCGVY